MARSATNVINFYEILPFFTIIWPYLIERFNGRFSTLSFFNGQFIDIAWKIEKSVVMLPKKIQQSLSHIFKPKIDSQLC